MQSSVKRSKESVVGVKRKIDGDIGFGGHCTGYLDIQHYFSIRVRIGSRHIRTRSIVTGNTNRGDVGDRDSKRSKVCFEVAQAKARTRRVMILVEVIQFDNADTLTLAL